MESPSSSKVTVEYFDPAGVFPLLSPSLLSRLPLRNLHWKSPSRPLRSISSLHVELVPHGQPAPPERASASGELSRPQSASSIELTSGPATLSRSQSHPTTDLKSLPSASTRITGGPVKERRHQIPGLRRTPYLKILLVRCDDNETYKATSRKQIREWVKEHTPPAQSSSSKIPDNHDAFEWLILHVVLPSTPAAAQPRWSGSAGADPGTSAERPSSASRWPGRGSSTILEKIRADFNGSNKTSTDRVAQVRLHKTDVPPHLAQTMIKSPATAGDDPQERETAWSDLISKLKSLILSSFDLRVSQYEEDIREKDAQRSLPGWNFCTFFVLKEGLARGFESVGLVEDALIGYDELAAGLDSILQHEASDERARGQGDTFISFTDSLWQKFESTSESRQSRARHAESSTADDTSESGIPVEVADELPLNTQNKNYRDLILSNNISVFDFQCYIFARQKSLLLRLGNASSSRAKPSSSDATRETVQARSKADPWGTAASIEEKEDLSMLAEICARAAEFTTAGARTMRRDLLSGYANSLAEHTESQSQHGASGDRSHPRSEQVEQRIDDLVCSWIFSVSQQILAETATSQVHIPSSLITPKDLKSMSTTSDVAEGQGFESIPGAATSMHPTRTSSIPSKSPAGMASTPGAVPQGAKPMDSEGWFSQTQNRPPPGEQFLKAGLEDLATNRAELYLLCRHALHKAGRRLGWSAGWKTVPDGFEGVDLAVASSERAEEPVLSHSDNAPEASSRGSFQGGYDQLLSTAMQKEMSFYSLYVILTEKALRHFVVGNRTRSWQRLVADLAAISFRQQLFDKAATYLTRLTNFYSETDWSMLEMPMLKMYASCVKELGRKEEYVHTMIELLAKSITEEEIRSSGSQRTDRRQRSMQRTNKVGLLDDESASATNYYIQQLLAYSVQLPYKVMVPATKFFDSIETIPIVHHFGDQDGFRLQLKTRLLLNGEMMANAVKVKLTGWRDGQLRDVLLENSSGVIFRRGTQRIWVETNAVVYGVYCVQQILLELENVVLVQEEPPTTVSAGPLEPVPAAAPTSNEGCRIICYPRSEALDVKIRVPRHICLHDARSLDIILETGRNNVQKGELRIRAASAGLRLRTAEAQLVKGDVHITSQSRPGVIEFGEISADGTIAWRIPYALEVELAELSVKVEIAYTTDKGDFLFSRPAALPTALPIGVSVQDIFKRKAFFCKFTVSSAGFAPLRLLQSKLEESETFDVEAGPPVGYPMLVFPEQPASLAYKLSFRSSQDRERRLSRERRPLALTIDYRCLDEEIHDAAELAFCSALKESPYWRYKRLLSPMLLSRLHDVLQPTDLERAGLLGHSVPPSYKEAQWTEVLHAIPTANRQEAGIWLRKWHEGHAVIPVSAGAATAAVRTIVIPVDVPQMHVLHTAKLRFGAGNGRDNVMTKVGDILAATVDVRHTGRWGSVYDSDAKKRDSHMPLESVYEIHADPDVWIVGGPRRVRFSAKVRHHHFYEGSISILHATQEDEIVTFPLMLIPLQAGHHLLPTVDIQAVNQRDGQGARAGLSSAIKALHQNSQSLEPHGRSRPSKGAGSIGSPTMTPGKPAEPEEATTRETDYLNLGQTIFVVPETRSTTMALEVDRGGIVVPASAVIND
ncbi:MAG: hypothetical protein M1817_005227 [Caeruleum heppii]|nr:MAG: hypothetical protein M1817_005227 [Caeruleum heppii]